MSTGSDSRRSDIETGINIERDAEHLKQSALDILEGRSDTGHARDDALSPRQFEQLVNATYRIENDRIELETRAVLYLAGRIGLRKGEITHLRGDWIDWSSGTLTVPDHQPCTKGTLDGEVCGYCRRRAEDRIEANNISEREAEDAIRHVVEDAEELSGRELDRQVAKLIDEVNISKAEALAERWQPKTPQSARQVPFDFDVRVELALERFFERFDGWERSAATLNRRVDRLAEISDVETRVYPHALRATAASYHAARDISVHSLMSIMGWSDPSTARAYVSANDDQAAREIRSKHR